MSEKRKPLDLGELRGVVHAVFQAWTSWTLFTATEKGEIVALLTLFTNIQREREQEKKNEEAQLNIRLLRAAMERPGEVQ